MTIVKSTYGVSLALSSKISTPDMTERISGSAVERKIYLKKLKDPIKEILSEEFPFGGVEAKPVKARSMSPRTKSKIRKKLMAFSRLHKSLSFLTLTFVNSVEDKIAIKVLHDLLDNVVKQDKNFQYLWVAEKQTKNTIFPNNIHFHVISNKFWNIQRWWQYWLDLQHRHGIVPRSSEFKPSSAFDVKHIRSNNMKGVVNYLVKYVTKNHGKFNCQVWNCSQKISWLYTDFYTDIEFVREFERLEKAGQLGGAIKIMKHEYCNIHLIPLNKKTLNFYWRLDDKNRDVWNSKVLSKS